MIALWSLNNAMGQWTTSGSNIFNSNTGNVGIGNTAPTTLLHVAKLMTEPTITVQNLGGAGGATYSMIDNSSGAFWKFKATNTGGFKVRDQANALDVFVIEPNSAANMIYINTAGNVGIFNASPNNMLDVNNGDIDVNTSTFGYMIGDQHVLRHKGFTDNILVGVDAGLSFTASGTNKFTFVGNGAGQNVTGGNDYTFVGYRAGFSNLGGSTNTFIGSEAGYSEMGDENVYVGWKSGYNSTNASYHNTFVGNVSGTSNKIGDNNTFIGIGTGGINQSGNSNVALGASAGMFGSINQNNSVAIGAGSMVRNSNQMILGDNSMQVGIGLSNDV